MRPEQILIKLSWDPSIDITFNPPLFSLVNTFNETKLDLLDLECQKTKSKRAAVNLWLAIAPLYKSVYTHQYIHSAFDWRKRLKQAFSLQQLSMAVINVSCWISTVVLLLVVGCWLSRVRCRLSVFIDDCQSRLILFVAAHQVESQNQQPTAMNDYDEWWRTFSNWHPLSKYYNKQIKIKNVLYQTINKNNNDQQQTINTNNINGKQTKSTNTNQQIV